MFFPLHLYDVCVCVRACVRACVRVCVCARARARARVKRCSAITLATAFDQPLNPSQSNAIAIVISSNYATPLYVTKSTLVSSN